MESTESFPATFNVNKEKKTKSEIRENYISRKFSRKTDRQLLEEQTHLARKTSKYLNAIKGILTFFLWFFCLLLIASVGIFFGFFYL